MKVSKSFKIILITLVAFMPALLKAQCAMCSATAELSGNGSGINARILYLFALPIIMIFGGGYFWCQNRRKFLVSDWEFTSEEEL